MRNKAAKQLRRMTPELPNGGFDKRTYKKLKKLHNSMQWFERYVG